MDNALGYLGFYPWIRIETQGSNNEMSFGFELPASETIASFQILTGEFAYFILS